MRGTQGHSAGRDGQRPLERVRIRFWNVCGTLRDICAPFRWDPEAGNAAVFQGAEVVVLTETGYEGRLHGAHVEGWARAKGWRKVVCSGRPYDPKHGGVAVFVRKGGSRPGEWRVGEVRACLVKDSPELGLAWVRLRVGNGPWLYLGCCYLPPKGSNYYTREGGRGGQLSADKHWWALGEGIREYRQLGEVLLVGDLNCRLGSHQGDGGYGEAAVGHRSSKDSSWDADRGGKLVATCEEHGLVVLNGRLPGDGPGMYTFTARGGQGSSVIDYAIASKGLVWDAGGAVKRGSRLEVWSWRRAVGRLTGGVYDHLPVTLTVMLSRQGGPAGEQQHTQPGTQGEGALGCNLRWQEALREGYVDVLVGDEEVQAKLRGVGTALSVSQASCLLEEAVRLAAAKTDTMLGRELGVSMVRRRQARVQGDRPRNKWYDEACRQAGLQCRDAERSHGEGSPPAVEAGKRYRQVVRAAHRRWERQEVGRRRAELAHKAKAFWAEFRGRQQAASHLIGEWTEYFKGLFRVAMAQAVPDQALADRLFKRAGGGEVAYQAAGELSGVITEGEVRAALRQLSLGKAAGVDGVPPEFFREAWVQGAGGPASNALVRPMVYLFNRVLREGYPEGWRVSAVCPVPKKAGAVERDDHRGIAVGTALAKLFSLVLLGRLDEWAEQHGVRAVGQYGFRKGRGTADAAFVLSHVVETYGARRKPVYAVFVDFRKAYDSVDRDTLWRCLAQLGVRGNMLQTLRDMYGDVRLRVRAGSALGPEFAAARGVRQGDPLSPLLFGLLLERIEPVLGDASLGAGVMVGQQRVVTLMYADDLVVLGEDPDSVQRVLSELNRCCACLMMEVNVGKTVGMVFNPEHHRGPAVRWMYGAEVVRMVQEFKYLGTVFRAEEAAAGAWQETLAAAKGAMFGMDRRCGVVGIDSVDLRLRLFDALVTPVRDFGSEVWGPKAASTSTAGVEAEKMQVQFMKRVFGVKPGVATAVVYREAAKGPPWAEWVRRAALFWNKGVARQGSDLVRGAIVEGCELARQRVGGGWVTSLRSAVQKLGAGMGATWALDIDGLSKLPAGLVGDNRGSLWTLALSRGAKQMVQGGAAEVRDVGEGEREGFKVYVHHRWFGQDMPTAGERARFWQVLQTRAGMRRVAQLRMGSHHLAVEEGRFAGVPRMQRVCPACNSGRVEDERHVLFECAGHAPTRARYADLHLGPMLSDAAVCQFMNPSADRATTFWPRMSIFVKECMAERPQAPQDQ